VDTFLTLLLSQPAWVAYAVVGVVILLEGAVPVGMLLPGEATALLGGATVVLGRSELVPMVLIVVAAATLGDGIGFRVGTVTGPRALRSRVLRSRRERITRLQVGLTNRGAVTLVAARWTAFVRTIVPALAGASGMPYRRFAPWNALGALTWGTTSVVLGALAGRSYAEVQTWLGGASAALLVGIVGAVGLVAVHRRRAAAAVYAPVGDFVPVSPDGAVPLGDDSPSSSGPDKVLSRSWQVRAGQERPSDDARGFRRSGCPCST
jgi:membrane protein DedA with SNARE-associated domain